MVDQAVPLPNNEEFKEADGLVIPWRWSACDEVKAQGCREMVRGEFYFDNFTLPIYNSDGSVWYSFGILTEDENSLRKNKKSEFKPLFIDYTLNIDIALRLVRISDSWYEVEIDEDTREAKYVPRKTVLWDNVLWEYWLVSMGSFPPTESVSLFHDKPNGKVIEDLAYVDIRKHKILKCDGDWIYVFGVGNGQPQYGWIKWRDGRKIIFNRIKGLDF